MLERSAVRLEQLSPLPLFSPVEPKGRSPVVSGLTYSTAMLTRASSRGFAEIVFCVLSRILHHSAVLSCSFHPWPSKP